MLGLDQNGFFPLINPGRPETVTNHLAYKTDQAQNTSDFTTLLGSSVFCAPPVLAVNPGGDSANPVCAFVAGLAKIEGQIRCYKVASTGKASSTNPPTATDLADTRSATGVWPVGRNPGADGGGQVWPGATPPLLPTPS